MLQYSNILSTVDRVLYVQAYFISEMPEGVSPATECLSLGDEAVTGMQTVC
jgi:hypothetical protein